MIDLGAFMFMQMFVFELFAYRIPFTYHSHCTGKYRIRKSQHRSFKISFCQNCVEYTEYTQFV